jgi:nuclear pore complex protein Nup155
MCLIAEHISQILLDDTRNLLYTLSSKSTINTFHMKPDDTLAPAVSLTYSEIHRHLTHLLKSRSSLLQPDTPIISISPISAKEASKLHLMATTKTGCRLFISATGSQWGWQTNDSAAPTSMQLQHVKFPPRQMEDSLGQQQQPSGGSVLDMESHALIPTRIAKRFAPGHFLSFVAKDPSGATDYLFLSSPDSGRIAQNRNDPTMITKYYECGTWMNLESRAVDVDIITAPFGAAAGPSHGFGNELAVQFDNPPMEIAILTNNGVRVVQRMRPVDIFAAMIRAGGGPEGVEGEIRKFIKVYGRVEATATALAVACGQGFEVSPEVRPATNSDADVTDTARKAFIDHGGKPVYNENSVVDQNVSPIESVRPSPRHEGTCLYISRLVRLIWKAPVLAAMSTPAGGLSYKNTISQKRLREIQVELIKVQEFLGKNKSYIEGLAGPDSILSMTNKQEEIANQAEHRAFHALIVATKNIIEGISFVLVLFNDKLDEIMQSLSAESRAQVMKLTYEVLFSDDSGRRLAKDLVKAIIDINIANGSNVQTIAEALRRKCGSFCSEQDVEIFKAQELLKRASEAGGFSDTSRTRLMDALRLYMKVASSLSWSNVVWAVEQFVALQFYAGKAKYLQIPLKLLTLQ